MSNVLVTSTLSAHRHKTPEGYLYVEDVAIARTGELFYAGSEIKELGRPANETLVVYRSEDEVFSPHAIASFEGKAITWAHPKAFVTADSHRELSIGHVKNVRRGTGERSHLLLADFLITDGAAISSIMQAQKTPEVSCGYAAEYVKDEATGRYCQTGIIGNHVAIVPSGRAGPECAVHDSIEETPMSALTTAESNLAKRLFAKLFDSKTEAEAPATVTPPPVAEQPDPAKAPAVVPPVPSADDVSRAQAALSAAEVAVVAARNNLQTVQAVPTTPPTELPPASAATTDKGDVGPILQQLQSQLTDVKSYHAEMSARMESLTAAIEKLSGAEPEAAAEKKTETADAALPTTAPPSATVAATQDHIARAEILVPGIDKTGDVRTKTLRAYYATADGKKAVEVLTGGRAPNFDAVPEVELLFNSASEQLKALRSFPALRNIAAPAQTVDRKTVIDQTFPVAKF